MGHTRAEDLVDLKPEIEKIRELERVTETKPGIFYYKRIPFLHFHDKDGRRWADVKLDGKWIELDIPFKASATKKKELLRSVSNAHKAILKEK